MRPIARIIFGCKTSICASRKALQAAHSSCSGSRFLGGRHFTIFAIKQFALRSSSMALSILSSSCPARPTNGKPCRSSSSPGPSPIIITSGFSAPIPGTVLLRVEASLQAVHERIFCAIASIESRCMEEFELELLISERFCPP